MIGVRLNAMTETHHQLPSGNGSFHSPPSKWSVASFFEAGSTGVQAVNSLM